jgi:uncharacterized membrane protein
MKHKTRRKLGKERLNALTEGVYAVVMTLMLLSVIEDIEAPGIDINHLPEILRELWPKFAAFFISFFVAGSLWIGDNVILDDVTHVDVRFLYLKMGNLLAVTLLGFSATLLGEHPQHWLVEVLYGLNMIVMYLGVWLSVRYALRNGLMERRQDNENLLQGIRRRMLIAAFGFTAATLLAFLNPLYSFRLFIVLGLFFSISSMFSSYEWAIATDEEK